MVVGPPGILLPAAQVQDRGDRRRARPRGDPGARHRPASEEERQGRTRLCRLCRRRTGPHADDRQEDPRLPAGRGPALLHDGDHARVQSLRPPRQQVQGAHQDPRARDRRRGVRPPGRGGMGGAEGHRAEAAGGRHPRHRRLFRAAAAGRAAGRRRGRAAGAARFQELRRMARPERRHRTAIPTMPR